MSTLAFDNVMRLLHRNRTSLVAKLRDVDNDIRIRTEYIQAVCDHTWTFIPDPSGNNDSEYHCSKCDKYSRRPE